MECPTCHQKNPEDALYCMRCGTNLVENASPELIKPATLIASNPLSYTPPHLVKKILNSRSVIEGERKRVTVLFCDIVGSTKLAERIGPDNMHALVNQFFDLALKEVHQCEGSVNQFLGDGFMALFGAPIAHEDHARRAVKAALSIQRAVQKRSFDLEGLQPVKLETRIGLNTGEVVLGVIGDDLRMDYTAVGDTTNLAARMEQNAEPGSVYLSENTYKAVKEYFDCEPLGKLSVKGKSKPIPTYKALKEKLRFETNRQIYSEIVGREKELNLLNLHLGKLLNGKGSIVSVIGESGIGKSRLVAEWRNSIDLKKTAVFEGRALSIGKNLSYHPLIDILKDWAGIRSEDAESQARAKLERIIRYVYPEGLSEAFPFIAVMMGMKLSGKYAERVQGIEGEALEKFIMKNLRDLIVKGSERRPAVYILEDLQWADLSSIELLTSLYRAAANHRVLFVNVLRPNYPETSERLLQSIRKRYSQIYTEINLQSLNEAQSRQLIRNLLKTGGLPGNIAAQITGLAEGNPYFIEEVILSLLDEGAIELRQGVFKVTGKIDSAVIPATIQDVLAARIDRLDEQTKQLLKNAAVIGRYFFYKILSEVLKNMGDLDARLGYLQDVQFILKSGRTKELEFLFKHVLAQEVAYESILHEKRKRLHLQVAAAIESIFKERLNEFYGMLALHYTKGEDREKAEEYLIKAGEEALKAAASSEALHYYQEALKSYLSQPGLEADRQKVASLKKNIALAYFNKGRLQEAVQYFDETLQLLGEKRPKTRLGRMWDFCLSILSVIRQMYFPKKSRRTLTDADRLFLDLAEKRGNALFSVDTKRFFLDSMKIVRLLNKYEATSLGELVNLYGGLGMLLSLSGFSMKFGGKLTNYESRYVNQQYDKTWLRYTFYKLIHNVVSGNWHPSPRYDDALIERYLLTGNFFDAGGIAVWSGFILVEQGDFEQAGKYLNKLEEIGAIYEHDYNLVRKYVLEAVLCLKRREFSAALDIIRLGVPFMKKLGQIPFAFWVLSFKAQILILTDQAEEAESTLSEAKSLVASYKRLLPFYQGPFLICQFLYDLKMIERSIQTGGPSAAGFQKAALQSGRAALRNAKKCALFRIESLRLMGVYCWLIGKQRKAMKWWDKSIRAGQQLDTRPELARTYMEVGKRLLEPKSKYREWNGIPLEGYLEKAQALFEEMELDWDLEQLKSIQAIAQRSLK